MNAAVPPQEPSDSPDAPARGHLCVVMHDVAPRRWQACLRVIERVREVAQAAGAPPPPLSLLVVPQLHGDERLPRNYLRWLHEMRDQGHELVLHGWQHRDDAPRRGLWQRVVRGHYTAGEGEFSALPYVEAQRRVALGQAWAAAHALPMRGFVAPAWLMNAPARRAVADAGFDYTCTLNRLIALPSGCELRARSLVFSTRSAWRRVASVVWNRWLARQERHAPLMRLELHPDDASHDRVLACWQRVLANALAQRRPVRLADAASCLRRRDGVPPTERRRSTEAA
jgi:predicted deacetylase